MAPLSFVNDSAPPEISALSLHDALPISYCREALSMPPCTRPAARRTNQPRGRGGQIRHAAGLVHGGDRKSTRLNSSHRCISYAVFCLKKKKTQTQKSDREYREPTNKTGI